jgi:hypothetical protein
MNQTLETASLPRSTEPAPRSPAAERMRLYRKRRRRGVICLQIELRETVIDGLIAKELLEPEKRHDPDALQSAIYDFFFEAL